MLGAAFTLCILCLCAPGAAADSKRLALVIGNSAYRTVSPLANPLNDARLVADALAASGFDVQLGADIDRKGMEAALKEFALDAMQADVAMVYFAGHGMEASGSNWLLPVDADMQSVEDLPGKAIPFEMVAGALAGASVKIVALDACRNNPFTARLASPGSTINRGLAEVELDGHVVIYAAAAGQVALDGEVNSPFAQTLSRWVGEPNVDLRLLAGKIRDDVIAATAGAQRPFVSASLSGQVTVLAPAAAGRVRDAATVQQRMPYHFDYVRTLRDDACTPTRTAKCHTESMLEAAGRIVTIEDDARLRIWDAESGMVIARADAPDTPMGPREVRFLAPASALVMSVYRDISLMPIDGGSPVARSVDHHETSQFVLAAGTPGVAVFAYPQRCEFGFVDLSSFALVGKTAWAPLCMMSELAWSLDDPGSDRFAARMATAARKAPSRQVDKDEELLLASYRSREVICRVAGAPNDAVFDAGGDLYTAHDDGTIVRRDGSCQAKRTYRLHQGSVERVFALAGGRMLSQSIDGVVKLWSPETGLAEKTLAGLSREASIVDVAEDGSAVLILNEDRRLYPWYGEPRLGAFVGPSAPVCAGAISADRDTVYALRCEGNVEVWRRQRRSE